MIKVLNKIPNPVYIAVSGGIDSMVCLDFLKKSRKQFAAIHFNHGTPHADMAEEFVRSFCKKNGIDLFVGSCQRERSEDESMEEYWRNERYFFFDSIKDKHPIITCHHLDDAVETWLFSAIHGKPKLIKYQRGLIIRPFLLTSKDDIEKWAIKNEVIHICDPSNADTKHMRNYIRHEMMPHVFRVNPGIRKVVRKKIMEAFANN